MAVERFTFTVTLEPADMLFDSLEAMQKLYSSALIMVCNQHIKIVTRNQGKTVGACLIMEASAVESSSNGHSAIQIRLRNWTAVLRRAVMNRTRSSIRIYKNDDSRNIFCFFGEDTSPISLGRAKFERALSYDNMQYQADAPAAHLRTQCLREVLTAFGSISSVVSVTYDNDSITWSTASQELRYDSQEGDYHIDSPGPIRSSVILLKWQGRSAVALRSASRIAPMVVLFVFPSTYGNFIAFHFVVTEGSHFGIFIRQPI